MLQDADYCVVCGKLCDVENDFDTSIHFGTGVNEVICRKCFQQSKYENLSASVQAAILLEEALEHRRDEPEIARELLQKSIKLSRQPDALALLAGLTEDVQEAIVMLTEAIQQDKFNVTAWARLPYALAVSGDMEKAKEMINSRDQIFGEKHSIFGDEDFSQEKDYPWPFQSL